jgi:Glycosyltransferase 61
MRLHIDKRRNGISAFLVRYSGITFLVAFLLLSMGHFRNALNKNDMYHIDRALKLEAQSTLATPVQDFSAGDLSVEANYYNQCVTVRFRGDSGNYTVSEAVERLKGQGSRPLRMGVEFMETPQRFFPVRIRETGSNYHLFHFVELLVIAYSELHRLANASQIEPIPKGGGTSLEQGWPAVTVPWILSPHMTPSETCGGSVGINCLIADLTLRASNASIFQDKSGIVGLDFMESYAYNPEAEPKGKDVTRRIQLADKTYGPSSQVTHAFTNQADGVIVVERFGCKARGINKPWSDYIESFPSDQWHADVMKGLGMSQNTLMDGKQKIVVGYIDRQNTDRGLPDDHHEWLVDYFSKHAKIQFLHLHMEKYPAIEQLKIASGCDVLIGVHGNGMTHAFWMTPRRYVVELFWRYPFQFDYATTAQLMKHNYLGILNGRALNRDMVSRRDPTLRQNKQATRKASVAEASSLFEQEGKVAIQDFIEKAILDLVVSADVQVLSWLVHA